MSVQWSGLRLYAFPPFSMIPSVLEKIVKDGAEVAFGSILAAETVVYEVTVSSCGPSQGAPVSGRSSGVAPVSADSSQTAESLSLTLSVFRSQGKAAGLSDRAADFSSEALRDSTRATYGSGLESYFAWGEEAGCDPSSASLKCLGGFLLSLFDRVLVVSTISSLQVCYCILSFGF